MSADHESVAWSEANGWPAPVEGQVVITYAPDERPARGPMNVYFVYDAAWELLYIGQTLNVRRRLRQHRNKNSWWWNTAAHALVIAGNTRDEAAVLEQSAIGAAAPPGNSHHRRPAVVS